MPTRNATKKRTNAPKRKAKPSGRHHRVSAKHDAPSRKKRNGRKTVRSSSRTRAARAGEAEKVVPHRRGVVQDTVIDDDSEQEVFGVLLSERARKGESKPSVPEKKVRNTRSAEPKGVPPTGVAKRRKRT